MKPEPLEVETFAPTSERRPLSVAGHHEWRESIAAPDRDFDEVDELVAELRELKPGGTEL